MIIHENRLRFAGAHELSKEHPDEWLNRGDLFYQEKNFTQARSAYTRAIEQDTNNARSWFMKGLALWNSNTMKLP
jgi:Tfp pilus assembly protein PilF